MIMDGHVIVYRRDPEADRALFADVLGAGFGSRRQTTNTSMANRLATTIRRAFRCAAD